MRIVLFSLGSSFQVHSTYCLLSTAFESHLKVCFYAVLILPFYKTESTTALATRKLTSRVLWERNLEHPLCYARRLLKWKSNKISGSIKPLTDNKNTSAQYVTPSYVYKIRISKLFCDIHCIFLLDFRLISPCVVQVLIETELSEESLWEDSDTQAFYEHLPDLKAIMPAILKDNARDDKVRQRLERVGTNLPPIGFVLRSTWPELPVRMRLTLNSWKAALSR